jgi:hypothetical protein
MNPLFILFGVRAAIRLAKTGADIYAQRASDRAAFLPELIKPNLNRREVIIDFFSLDDRAEAVLQDPAVQALLDQGRPISDDARVIDELFVVVVEAKAAGLEEQEDLDASVGLEIAGGVMIEQWRASAAPISPFGRIAVTMADIALEFVAVNPAIMGVGGNGERLIAAFAGNLAALIPDDVDEFGPSARFVDRLTGIFLRAGLSTLAEHPDLVLDEAHTQKLVAATLTPLIAELPEDLGEQMDWRAMADALAGPVASAAFATLAENPQAFFGAKFAPDKAVGAVTQALLVSVSETGLKEQFTLTGVLALYRAGLGVAANRPELFVGDDDSVKTQLFQDLLSGVAGALRDHAPFDGELGAELAAVGLDALGEHGGALLKLDDSDAWERTAQAMIVQVTGALSERLRNPETAGALAVFTHLQLLELGRIFMVQAAATPGMLGVERSELKAIVSGVASAMAADEELLLTADDWLVIAAVAAEEAAANPGRLFGLDESSAAEALASQVITSLLTVAAAEWRRVDAAGASGRDAGSVLFGDTLREAIVVVLRTVSGNVRAALAETKPVEQLASAVSEVVRDKPDAFGSKEWLRLFRALLGQALADGSIEISEDQIRELIGSRVEP